MYYQEKHKQSLTIDLTEISDVSYGLLNTDKWSELLAKAVSKQIEGFKIKEADEITIKKQISGFLTKAIDNFETRYNNENKGSGISAMFKRSLSTFAGIFDQIKKQIPVFTDEIYTFLTESGQSSMIEQFISVQFKEYTKGTFSETNYTIYNSIINKYEAKNQTEAVLKIENKLLENKAKSELYQWFLGGIFIAMVCLFLVLKNPTSSEFIIQIFYSLSLLVLGIFLPMIAIDARISELNFSFLEEKIQFSNQVLLYRSKSIIEVVELLFLQERIDLIFVGFLIFLFSVLFPVSKLVASIFYTLGNKLKQNKLIKFLVFKTSKWSMADVFVIALFMAYLGFDGILSDQLNQLQTFTKTVKVITTNQSDLLFGFYAFTTFVLYSLFISFKIKKFN